jgi:hypothetical protein
MPVPHLIISDPPHHVADPKPAAPVFGLSAAEIRLKANYPVPEIWVVDMEVEPIESALALLNGAGFNALRVRGSAIAEVPDATTVRAFEFTPDGLMLTTDAGRDVLPYDGFVVGVFCQTLAAPRLSRSSSAVLSGRVSHFVDATEGYRRSGAKPGSDESPTSFLDLYTLSGGSPRRFTFAQDTVDFAGLGEPSRRASDNLLQLIAEYQGSFPHGILDRRCAAMRVRRNVMVAGRTGPAEPDARRKGFSFGTTALVTILELVSPELKTMTQPELSSRLVYLTHRERGALAPL